MTDDDVEYCAKCGDAEFDEDGNETHTDEEEYGHDFEPEEPTTLEDVKEFADTVKSLAEAGKAVKELTQPSKIDPSELTVNRFKVPPPPINKIPDLEIAEHPDAKAEKRHKQMMKLGIIGIIVATLLGIAALIL